jgi:hypothetical protein
MEKSDIRVFEKFDKSGNVIILRASYEVSLEKHILMNDVIQCPEIKKEVIDKMRDLLYKHHMQSGSDVDINVRVSV